MYSIDIEAKQPEIVDISGCMTCSLSNIIYDIQHLAPLGNPCSQAEAAYTCASTQNPITHHCKSTMETSKHCGALYMCTGMCIALRIFAIID